MVYWIAIGSERYFQNFFRYQVKNWSANCFDPDILWLSRVTVWLSHTTNHYHDMKKMLFSCQWTVFMRNIFGQVTTCKKCKLVNLQLPSAAILLMELCHNFFSPGKWVVSILVLVCWWLLFKQYLKSIFLAVKNGLKGTLVIHWLINWFIFLRLSITPVTEDLTWLKKDDDNDKDKDTHRYQYKYKQYNVVKIINKIISFTLSMTTTTQCVCNRMESWN